MKSVKDIVNECFPEENWEMEDWKEEFKNKIGRKGADRDLFIQTLIEAFEEIRL